MFLTDSKVHIIGSTVMRPLDAWAKDNNLDLDAVTPLGNIAGWLTPVHLVEFMGRHCYRSWTKGRDTQAYIDNIIEEQHTSVLEHTTINFALSGISRSCSHELVRHRVGVAISQESQRYVDAKDVNFIVPPLYLFMCEGDLTQNRVKDFMSMCEMSKDAYVELTSLIPAGISTTEKKRRIESARSVLPNAAETRMGWTANITALRHFFVKRGAQGADLEIRRLAVNIFKSILNDNSSLSWFFKDMTLQPGDFDIEQIVKV